MVGVDVPQVRAVSQRHQPLTQVEVSGNIPAGQILLEILAYINGGLPALGLLDSIAVAIVDKGDRAYRRGLVLCIPASLHASLILLLKCFQFKYSLT